MKNKRKHRRQERAAHLEHLAICRLAQTRRSGVSLAAWIIWLVIGLITVYGFLPILVALALVHNHRLHAWDKARDYVDDLTFTAPPRPRPFPAPAARQDQPPLLRVIDGGRSGA